MNGRRAHSKRIPSRAAAVALAAILGGFGAAASQSDPTASSPAAMARQGDVANADWLGRWLFGVHYLVGRMNAALDPSERFRNLRMPADPLPLETFMLGALGTPLDTVKLDRQLIYLQGLGVNFLVVEWWKMRRAGLYHPDGPNDYIETVNHAAGHGMLVAPFIPRIVLSPGVPLPEYIQTLQAEVGEILNIYPRQWLLNLFDKNGQPRIVVMLHETPICKPGQEKEYIASFDAAAEAIFKKTGVRVGWTMARREARLPSKEEFQAWKQGDAFLAYYALAGLSRFYPGRTEYYQKLADSGLPIIAGLLPGMVKPETVGKVGFDKEFLSKELGLGETLANRRIVTFDIFNGFLEGRGIYPTKQDGDLAPNWAREVVARLKNTNEKEVLPPRTSRERREQ